MNTVANLRAFLDERGVRYSWVAEHLGIGKSHMTRLMEGERPLTEAHKANLIALFGDEVRVCFPPHDVEAQSKSTPEQQP